MIGVTFSALCYAAAHGFLYFGGIGTRLAIAMLGLAVRCNPKNHQARAWLGYLAALRAMRSGHAESAVKLLREASREAPGETPIRANLGIALTMAGQHQEAIHVLRGVMRDSGDTRGDSQAWRALAWCQLRTGQTRAAAETLVQAEDAGVRSKELDIIAELCRLSGEAAKPTVQASGRLQSLLRSRPRMIGLALEFAEHEAASGHMPVAKHVLSELPPDFQADGLRLMAASRLNADDIATAQSLVDLLAQLHPGEADVGILRSELAVARKRYDRAVEHALAAAEAEPNDPRPLHQLGLSLLHAGQVEDAGKQFAAALAAGSSSALAAGVVALQLLAQDKADDARKVFVRERTGDALGCAYAHTAQALLLAEAGDWKDFERLVEWAEGSWNELPAATRAAPVVAPLLSSRERMLAILAQRKER